MGSMFYKSSIPKIIFAVILLGMFIFFSNAAPVEKVRSAVVSALKPLMKLSSFIGRTHRTEDAAEATQLENRLNAANLARLEKLETENRELKKLLGFKEVRKTIKGARVLLHQKEFVGESLLLDLGKEDGLTTGDPVFDSKEIFIGVLREVGEASSKVSLASNYGETHEVEILPLGVRSLAKGLGGRVLRLELVPAETPVKAGDFVFYSARGISLALGKIVSEKTAPGAALKELRATLFSRPEILEEVFVVAGN